MLSVDPQKLLRRDADGHELLVESDRPLVETQASLHDEGSL